jgi:hypothetical protein
MRPATHVKMLGAALAGVCGMGLVVSAPSALAFSCAHRLDSFNRPPSLTLGPSWTEQSPGIGIQHLKATNPAYSSALATYNGAKSHSACADVYTRLTGIQYVAIVLGYKNLAHSIFLKVQETNPSSGQFDKAYAYRGNNTPHPLGTGRDSKRLTPFSGAEIYATWTGSTVKLLISTAFNNRPQQKFVIHGVSTSGLGKKIGLGIYGGAYADNFAIR